MKPDKIKGLTTEWSNHYASERPPHAGGIRKALEQSEACGGGNSRYRGQRLMPANPTPPAGCLKHAMRHPHAPGDKTALEQNGSPPCAGG